MRTLTRLRWLGGTSGRKALGAAAVAVGLVAAACSSNYGAAGGGNTTPPTTTAPSPVTTSPTGGGSSGGSKAVTLEQGAGGALAFSPKTLTVKRGQKIDVKNVSSIPHTFTISSKGINVVNSGGQSKKVTIKLAPGTYQFVCTFHQSLGMVGTLTVT